MDRMIVVVFDEEKQAYEATRALAALDIDGNITIYGSAVIFKTPEGQITVLDADDDGPVGTVSGTLVGSVIGALGGPLGLAVGASLGTLGGMWYDVYNSGVGMQFLDDVGNSLTPGRYAVVAEILEEWTEPVDTRMEELGGIVFRRARIMVEDNQFQREINAANAELDQVENEWNQAAGESREKLHAKVEAARDSLNQVMENASNKLNNLSDEADARMAVLQDKIARCEGETKAKIEVHAEEIRKDYERRSSHLKDAWESVKAALSQ